MTFSIDRSSSVSVREKLVTAISHRLSPAAERTDLETKPKREIKWKELGIEASKMALNLGCNSVAGGMGAAAGLAVGGPVGAGVGAFCATFASASGIEYQFQKWAGKEKVNWKQVLANGLVTGACSGPWAAITAAKKLELDLQDPLFKTLRFVMGDLGDTPLEKLFSRFFANGLYEGAVQATFDAIDPEVSLNPVSVLRAAAIGGVVGELFGRGAEKLYDLPIPAEAADELSIQWMGFSDVDPITRNLFKPFKEILHTPVGSILEKGCQLYREMLPYAHPRGLTVSSQVNAFFRRRAESNKNAKAAEASYELQGAKPIVRMLETKDKQASPTAPQVAKSKPKAKMPTTYLAQAQMSKSKPKMEQAMTRAFSLARA